MKPQPLTPLTVRQVAILLNTLPPTAQVWQLSDEEGNQESPVTHRGMQYDSEAKRLYLVPLMMQEPAE